MSFRLKTKDPDLVFESAGDIQRVCAVFVRDRHSTENVTCVAQAKDLTGAGGWSETKSSSGEGEQTLVFGPAVGAPLYGPYAIVCSIPAMEEANVPSYISSYVVVEP